VTTDLVSLLPHRSPMLLVDRVVERDGDTLVAEWTVLATSPWLRDGRFPESLVLESWLQTAALLHSEAGESPGVPVVGAITGVRTFRRVVAGDVLHHQVRKVRTWQDSAVFEGSCTAAGLPVMTVERTVVATRAIDVLGHNGSGRG